MVRHDNVHRVEWPLGVITATYPDEKGVIGTAEVEECGRRTLRPVTFLVPLELDCHHDDDIIRRSPSDDDERGNDDNDDDVYNDVTTEVDSTSEAGNQASSSVSAGAQGGSFFLTCHLTSQHIFIRRAAPERAVWPTAPHVGATPTQLLQQPPHRLSHHTT